MSTPPAARCKSQRIYFEVHHTCKAEANLPTTHNCCSVAWGGLSTHSQPDYISNCDICIKSMIPWQEYQSGVGGKIQYSVLHILRKCGTVG